MKAQLFVIAIQIGILSFSFPQSTGIELQECVMNDEPIFCYYCDSHIDPYCGDAFQYSHYYTSKEIYLTECMGCCIKIVFAPVKNGLWESQRIVRSCTETMTRLNFTLNDNCNSWEDEEKRICLCDKELCNSSTVPQSSILIFVLATFVIFNYLWIGIYLSYQEK